MTGSFSVNQPNFYGANQFSPSQLPQTGASNNMQLNGSQSLLPGNTGAGGLDAFTQNGLGQSPNNGLPGQSNGQPGSGSPIDAMMQTMFQILKLFQMTMQAKGLLPQNGQGTGTAPLNADSGSSPDTKGAGSSAQPSDGGSSSTPNASSGSGDSSKSGGSGSEGSGCSSKSGGSSGSSGSGGSGDSGSGSGGATNAGSSGNSAGSPVGNAPNPSKGDGNTMIRANFEGGKFNNIENGDWDHKPFGPQIKQENGKSVAEYRIPPGGQRNESVVKGANFKEGDDRWFGFNTKLGDGVANNKDWQVITQWKNEGTGSPPAAIHVQDGRYILETQGPNNADVEHKDLGPAVPGQWENFKAHIVFSSDPGKAKIEIVRTDATGKQYTAALQPKHGTLNPGKDSYLKMGYYRDTSIQTDGSVQFANFNVGSTEASVQ